MLCSLFHVNDGFFIYIFQLNTRNVDIQRGWKKDRGVWEKKSSQLFFHLSVVLKKKCVWIVEGVWEKRECLQCQIKCIFRRNITRNVISFHPQFSLDSNWVFCFEPKISFFFSFLSFIFVCIKRARWWALRSKIECYLTKITHI